MDNFNFYPDACNVRVNFNHIECEYIPNNDVQYVQDHFDDPDLDINDLLLTIENKETE